jgi:hypothetical protein
MNVGLILRRITGRHRNLRWRQMVDHIRGMRSIRYWWLFNHTHDEMQHDCRKEVHD